MYKKNVYIYYGLRDIAIPRDNCHRQEDKIKTIIVETGRFIDGLLEVGKNSYRTPSIITGTGFRR